jgi:hypothetical protein
VRAAFLAAADRPAAPLVRAALRAAAERSTAVRRVAVRVDAVRAVDLLAGREDRAAGADVFRPPRAAVRAAAGRRRVVLVVRFDALAARVWADALLRVRGFAVARGAVLAVPATRLCFVMPVAAPRVARRDLRSPSPPSGSTAWAVAGLPARFALRVFTMVCLSGM